MSTYLIEKGLPLPSARKSYDKYPWREMEVGDSFFVDKLDARSTLYTAASWFAARNPGFKFSVRREGTGFRVWRIEA